MLTKPKRHRDRALLDYIKTLPCICCRPGEQTTATDPQHITSVGARGGDYATNVMPLCRKHHTENHKSGFGKMIKKYSTFKTWLELAGRDDVFARVKRGK